jgi:hypothetical protein
MNAIRWIATCVAFAALVFPALSFADHHNTGEESAQHPDNKAGGKAAEHRSEKAGEKSNAQWDEDNEGRPERVSGEDDQAGDDDQDEPKKDEQEKQGKQDRKSKKDKRPKSNE